MSGHRGCRGASASARAGVDFVEHRAEDIEDPLDIGVLGAYDPPMRITGLIVPPLSLSRAASLICSNG